MSDREPDARGEDELWRSIVDNYGDRAELTADELRARVRPEAPPPGAADDEAELGPGRGADDPERFVAPDPPPMPLPRGRRLAAWLGVLIAPLAMLTLAVAPLRLPALGGLALVAWFVGGFGYLVATMPRGPRDPGDDGAVV